MPKMKTHSATKKRFKITGSGKVSFKKSGRGHLLSSKNSKRLRTLMKKGILPTGVEAHVKKMLPYA
ncbi:MAG: 50S ribosomal protein L35 [Cloacibacillus porcorum]|uniref:50S ribosomal protein L35 n=1 Tax=Cloacibacillus porcorum TaxID=1197717 RepID=UPI0023F07981|nr:50S ribosomal protein L35 [Cloacibacillus porcorum]MCD7875362.1 50S ribosomal protein L35 [Cloacibacillus porcorum]